MIIDSTCHLSSLRGLYCCSLCICQWDRQSHWIRYSRVCPLRARQLRPRHPVAEATATAFSPLLLLLPTDLLHSKLDSPKYILKTHPLHPRPDPNGCGEPLRIRGETFYRALLGFGTFVLHLPTTIYSGWHWEHWRDQADEFRSPLRGPLPTPQDFLRLSQIQRAVATRRHAADEWRTIHRSVPRGAAGSTKHKNKSHF